MAEPAPESGGSPRLADADAVGKKVGQGAAWSLLNNAVLRAGSLLSGIVLAHLLSPEDFGLYAVALVALTLLQSMNELGVSLAIVRWDGDLDTFAPTVMTIAITSSAALFGAIFAIAPVYCNLMGAPTAVGVVRWLCVAVVLDGIAAVPAGILNRAFMQRRRLYCDFASFAASTALTIDLATHGFGAMSFVWGRILGNLISCACYLTLCPVKIRPGWRPTEARALLSFGIPLAGASLLVLSVSNVDNIVVGATLSKVALGYYLMAFNQSSWPLTVFSEAARRVSLAGFSRLVNDAKAFERAFRQGTALLMGATVPVCVMLAVYAEPMLRAVYGDKWAPAATPLRFLAGLGLIRVALFVAYDALVALGKSRTLIGLQAAWLTCLIPALVVGTNLDGIRGTSIAHLLVAGVVITPLFLIALRRCGIATLALFRPLIRPALGGVAIAVAAVVVFRFTDDPWPRLLFGAAISAVVYIPIVLPMQNLLPGRGSAQGRHQRMPLAGAK